MSVYKRFLIGGIGGLAPVLMFLALGDWDRYIIDATPYKIAGYGVRGLALFILGGIIAYLHSDERKPFKLFELGLGAPALVAGALTSALVSKPADYSHNISLSIVGVAFAQSVSATSSFKRFSLSVQSPANQFIEGLVGGTPKNVWFVIIGSYNDVSNAQKQATQINQQYPQFKAEVYAPYDGEGPYYRVVIGSNLTQSEAKALRDNAVKAGLPNDSYYRTFPNLPPADALR